MVSGTQLRGHEMHQKIERQAASIHAHMFLFVLVNHRVLPCFARAAGLAKGHMGARDIL